MTRSTMACSARSMAPPPVGSPVTSSNAAARGTVPAGRAGARALDHVPARRVLGPGGRGQAEDDTGAAFTLVTQRLPDGGQPGGRGGVGIVPAGDGDVAGHAAAGPGRSAERAEGQLVAHRGDRVGRVVTAEQLFGGGLPEPGGGGLAPGDPRAGR